MNSDQDWLLAATDPDPNRAEKVADDELSMALLAGATTKPGGSVQYLEPDSAEEKRARSALARRIRDHMPGFTGELLALAIDPDTKSRFVGMVPTRKIRFENLKKGHASRWRRDLIIAHFIEKQLAQGHKPEIAYAKACEEFGVSRGVAQRTLDWHREAMKDAAKRNLAQR
jgi:hypothetical protein